MKKIKFTWYPKRRKIQKELEKNLNNYPVG